MRLASRSRRTQSTPRCAVGSSTSSTRPSCSGLAPYSTSPQDITIPRLIFPTVAQPLRCFATANTSRTFRKSILTGDLALPPDGPTAWVSRIDLAEGIARLMLQKKPLPETVLLAGPEALDFAQVAEIAGLAVGRS